MRDFHKLDNVIHDNSFGNNRGHMQMDEPCEH